MKGSSLSLLLSGVTSLKVDKTGAVDALQTSQQEEPFPLAHPVTLGECLESNLNALKQAMHEGIRAMSGSALRGCSEGKGDWYQGLHLAVVSLAVSLHRTAQLETAIAKGQLRQQLQATCAQVSALTGLLLKGQSEASRHKLGGLVILLKHTERLTERLLQRGVASIESSDWLLQLRFYLRPEGSAFARTSIASLEYGYDSLEAGCELAITEELEQSHVSLCQALELGLGLAVVGRAGLGKTETVKNVGLQLGRPVVVYNCSDQMDYVMLRKMLKGLAGAGCWGCLDEFNRICVEVLAALLEQLNTVFAAVRARSKLDLDGH